jgi:phosphatidylserine decarboxylase
MLPLTRHGFREMLIGSVVLLIVAVGLGLLWLPFALFVIPVLIWLFAFFRDPHRVVPTDQHAMVSPADGTVSDITELENFELLGGPCVRIGIFLSVFNVHAMSHARASEENESNTIVLAEPTAGEKRVAVVKQIVGLIARTIVFTAGKGDLLERGERIGMIKFGSRTELYIPGWLKPTVSVDIGQSVRAGADIVARLGEPIHGRVDAPDANEFEPLIGRETPA